MAIVLPSVGYPGTITPGKKWAELQWGLGTRYWVYHQDNVRVTPVPGGTRQVSISAGHFGAWGIHDYNDAPVTVALPTVASGTKWFLIVARRTWQTTNATTFTWIDCGTSPTYPALRNTEPGVIDDQPLAFVPLTAGATVPGTPRDARVIGTSPENLIITDEIALGYMAYVGVRLRLGSTQYVRGLNEFGNPVWQIEGSPFVRSDNIWSDAFGGGVGGWAYTGLGSRVQRYGNVVDLKLNIRKISGTVPVGSGGGVQDLHIFNLNPEWRPTDNRRGLSCTYINTDLANSQGAVTLGADGRLFFTTGTPNRDLRWMPSGSWSLEFNYSFIQRGA